MTDQLPQQAEPVDEPERRLGLPALPKRWQDRPLAEVQAEVIPEVMERLAEGETMTQVCATRLERDERGRPQQIAREPGSWPARTTVYTWIGDNEGLARQFARARALGIEAWRDQQLAIADDCSRDYVPTKDGLVFDSEHVQRSKLRIWAREQLIARVRVALPGDEVSAVGAPKVLPPRIEVVGVVPKGQAVPGGGDDAGD